jgi:choline dehydrogenase
LTSESLEEQWLTPQSSRLVSADPTVMPNINSGYFSQGADSDLDAMQEATEFFRGIFNNVSGNAFSELYPCASNGCSVKEQKETLRTQAWSHHATSTCAIGADSDSMAVLDSKFRVRGVTNLRVVDGSAFPKVPGAFPVAATFMISEKASAVILADL